MQRTSACTVSDGHRLIISPIHLAKTVSGLKQPKIGLVLAAGSFRCLRRLPKHPRLRFLKHQIYCFNDGKEPNELAKCPNRLV